MRNTTRGITGFSLLCAVVFFATGQAGAVCSSGGTVSHIADCIPGGSASTDCRMEFSVTPIPPLNSKGLRVKNITCYDNGNVCSVSFTPCLADSDCPGGETCSVPCDLDKTPSQCTFKVGFCFNVSDSRLTACTPGQTDAVTLKKPSDKDATKAEKNPFGRNNLRNLRDPVQALVPTATGNACTDEGKVVVPLKQGTKKGKQVVKATSVDTSAAVSDTDALKLTCLPNPNIASLPISSCRQVTSASELIGGAVAVGRVGDWLLENDKIRVLIRDVGRAFSFVLTHGGHIVDADVVREPTCSISGGSCSVNSDCPDSETCVVQGRDNFIGMTPLINISSSDEPTSIACLNDGSGGGAAILRTVGDDDLFDPVNPWVAIKAFSTSLSVPAKAVDMDIPVTVENHYSLAPGDDYVTIETAITNNAVANKCAAPPSNFGVACSQDSDCDYPGGSGNGQCGTLALYVGDYLNGGGQVDEVAPGLGFGNIPLRLGASAAQGKVTLDWVTFTGVGDGQGVSYGIIPELFDLTGAFSDSGVTVPVYGQELVPILLSQVPGTFVVAPGETRSFTRYFVVGHGGTGEVMDARNEIFGVRSGYIQGTVKVDGVPQDGARVTIVKGVLPSGDLISVFETSNGGFYQGTLPRGTYKVLAKVPGVNHFSSTEQTVTITGGTEVVDFNLTPEPAYLKVVATNGVSLGPLPVKVSVVGLRQSDPLLSKFVPLFDVTLTGGVFGTEVDNKVRELPFGLVRVGFAGPSGILGGGPSDPFELPPGDYQIVVSHGPEYSVYKQNVTLTSGATEVVNASLVPVVDSTGFISQDAHVHMINSPDSWVTKEQRILTMLGEGVDHFVASDHDFVTDLTADIAELGATGLIQFSPSDEITTFNIGHFGAYPLTPEPASITGGAVDWGGGPGYPSGGSYDLTPAQIVAAARTNLGAIVVQANHVYSYFEFAGIDTTVIPPVSSNDNSLLRQDPAATNLFTSDVDALEVWIENTRAQNDRFRGENLGDWLNLLNGFDSTHPEMRFTGVADSDTHHTDVIQAAGPRTFVASSTDTPALIDRVEIANNIVDGRAIGSNGPFVRVEVIGESDDAGLDLGRSLLARTSTGTVNVHVHVESPTWAEFDRIEIFANAVPICTTEPHPFLGGSKALCTTTPTITLNKGTDFPVSTVPINGDFRLEADVTRTLTVGTTDTWVLVVVRGTDGKSKPLFPMNPLDIHKKACSFDPCQECTANSDCPGNFNLCNGVNTTLAQLTDGNLGQCGVLSLAFTNPLFVDADADGEYKGVPF